MKEFFSFFLICILLTNCISKQESTCFLTGKVIGRDSKSLILIKQTEDARYCGVTIPIDSLGYFKYLMKYPVVEAYELIFKDEHDRGSWKPILFFPDIDTIHFTLYREEKFDSNKVVGGELSGRMGEFNKQMINNPITNEIEYWYQQKDSLRHTGKINTEYSILISEKLDSLFTAGFNWQVKYFWKESNMFGYSMFLNTILTQDYRRKYFSVDTLKSYSKLFIQKFPGHPYNTIADNLFISLENIKVGGKCIDFTAPDSTGTSVTLSTVIVKNKLTLIDLWSPWCGPCIKKSKDIIPVFEEFKILGFGVISVVGGISNQKQYFDAIERYKYPWVILSEIENRNKIWEKYNISSSGGGQFLVDKTGKIIAINPNSEDLRKILKNE